jgi:ribosome biogenesis protein ERB1
LTDKQLEVIQRIKSGKAYTKKIDENAYRYELSTADQKRFIHPFDAADPPKRRFMPSKFERIKINKLVHAIQRGWLKTSDDKESEEEDVVFDIWSNNEVNELSKKLPPSLVMPKMNYPKNDESYNPPAEYLWTPEEIKNWKESHVDDRTQNYFPVAHKNLRQIQVYEPLIKERFERCLDLYLAPRIRKKKVEMNPDDLLPDDLPPASALRPFPSFPSVYYKGHKNRVRTIAVSKNGKFLVSGDDGGLVLVFDVLTSRILKRFKFKNCVVKVMWDPNSMLLVGEGDTLYFFDLKMFEEETSDTIADKMKTAKTLYDLESTHNCEWTFYVADEKRAAEDAELEGLVLKIKLHGSISEIAPHWKGDYLATVCPKAQQNNQVIVHSLTKGVSHRPFGKSKSNVQTVLFHTKKPLMFIVTQTNVWVFDLSKQSMVRKLVSGAKWYSSIDLHPGGDNIICGTYDRRLIWYDLDMGSKPYKTLKYHKKAIRSVKFSKSYPLFASCSDDGGINIFHSMVYSDLLTNALIVPLKVLKGHKIVDEVGVLDVAFHPSQPWVFSSGADHQVILWC